MKEQDKNEAYASFTKASDEEQVIRDQFVQHFSEPNKSKKTKRIISWDMSLI